MAHADGKRPLIDWLDMLDRSAPRWVDVYNGASMSIGGFFLLTSSLVAVLNRSLAVVWAVLGACLAVRFFVRWSPESGSRFSKRRTEAPPA